MREIQGDADGRGRRVCVVAARFNRLVTERLAGAARRTLVEAGCDPDDVDVAWVPGAWELPWASRRAVASGYDAVVAVGCVVRGETPHFDYICDAAAGGLAEVGADGDAPVTFGVLTCDTMEQALDRAGGEHGNKGADAAEAALELLDVGEKLG